MIDLSKLSTEGRNPASMNLDEMSPGEILRLMNQEDRTVAEKVEAVLPEVEQVVRFCTAAFAEGGRLIYLGAGTSGRLGVLDAVECPPTFGVEPEMVVGLIAGGDAAFVKAVEGAEDSPALGEQDLKQIKLTNRDVVVGIAASGRTPYVKGGLQYAQQVGAKTAVIVCSKDASLACEAEIVIEAVVGPEVLTGSTRLKAGTATKLICNMISTASMIGIGKSYQNLMVDVKQSNEKLVKRAEHIVMTATECDSTRAKQVLEQTGGEVKTAIVSILLACDIATAREKLQQAKGHIRVAIKD